jgi:hypothetical protein
MEAAKRRKIEKLRDALKGTDTTTERLVERMDKNNELLSQLIQVLTEKELQIPDKIKVENLSEISEAVQVGNFPETQKVEVVNQNPQPPAVQKVEVTNHPESDMPFMMKALETGIKAFGGFMSKLWNKGLYVKLDESERRLPLLMIQVDEKGNPVKTTVNVHGGGGGAGYAGPDKDLQVKYDWSGSLPIYKGTNTNAVAADTDTNWMVTKYFWSGSSLTNTTVRAGAWSDRTILF